MNSFHIDDLPAPDDVPARDHAALALEAAIAAIRTWVDEPLDASPFTPFGAPTDEARLDFLAGAAANVVDAYDALKAAEKNLSRAAK